MQRQPRATEPASQAQLRLSIVLFALALACFSSDVAQAAPRSPESANSTPARRIVVSIPDRKLALLENGHLIRIYSVAVGAPQSPSPSGEFQIVQRLENPTYFHPGVVIAPGPANPIGTRWIGLNVKGFGIHGTNRPGSIGKNASHGCVRLRNRDMEDLFARVRVGDRVSLLAERTSESAEIFGAPTNAGATQVARNDLREASLAQRETGKVSKSL
jgi:lipoprotein-anchoring transpeptidase ErfK/SrfK